MNSACIFVYKQMKKKKKKERLKDLGWLQAQYPMAFLTEVPSWALLAVVGMAHREGLVH